MDVYSHQTEQILNASYYEEWKSKDVSQRGTGR